MIQCFQKLLKQRKLYFSLAYQKSNSYPLLKKHTISKELEITTNLFPDKIGAIFHHQNIQFTWSQIFEQSQKIAANLLQLGLKKGDKVGVFLPNCYQWYLTQMACSLADLIFVTINPAYKEHELKFCINHIELNTIITTNLKQPSEIIQVLNNLIKDDPQNNKLNLKLKNLPTLKKIFVVDIEEQNINENYLNFNELLLENDPQQKYLSIVKDNIIYQNPYEPVNIQFTSGTTGLPKGVILNHCNILNNGYLTSDRIKFTSNDIICLPVPLYHCFGMVVGNLAALTTGSCLLFSNYVFNAQKTMESVEQYKATTIYGVPTMFIEFIKEQQKNKRNIDLLQKGIMAGSLCPESLLVKVKQILGMKQMCVAYGMTETSPISFMIKPDDCDIKKTKTVGSLLPHTEIKVVNDNKIVNKNEEGELMVKGYLVMDGYYNNQKANEFSLENGWMKSGDLVELDNDGFLSVTGRSKDLIIRGGENISPKEIEEFLLNLQEIENVQIIGVPDEKYGEEICAYIKLKENMNLEKIKIKEFCKGRISHFKIPKYVRFVNDLPITVTGKPQKFKMREQWNELIKKENIENYQIRQLIQNLNFQKLIKYHLNYFLIIMQFSELKESADKLVQEKNFQQAIKQYQIIIENQNFKNEEKLKYIYFNKGYCLFNLKQFQQAIQSFDQALSLDRLYVKPYYYRGLSFENLNDFKNAIETYQEAIQKKVSEKIFIEKIQLAQVKLNEQIQNFDYEKFLLEKITLLQTTENLEQIQTEVQQKIQSKDSMNAIQFLIDFLKQNENYSKENMENIIEYIMYPLIVQFKGNFDNKFKIQLSDFWLIFAKNSNQDNKILKIITSTILRNEHYLKRFILEILPLKETVFILNFFTFFQKNNNLQYSCELIMIFINFFTSMRFDFNPFEFGILDTIVQNFFKNQKYNKEDQYNIINSIYNKFFFDKPVICLTLIKNFINTQLVSEENINLIGEKIEFIIQNLKFFITHGIQNSSLRDRFFEIVISILSIEKLLKYVQSKEIDLMKVILSVKTMFKDQQNQKTIVLLEILGLIKIQKKLTFSEELYSKILYLLQQKNYQFHNFVNLNMLIYNGKYFAKLIEEKQLQKYLLSLKFLEFGNYFVFFEFLYNFFDNTYLEKMKLIQKNHSLEQNDKESLEKLSKMMDNNAHFIKIEFLKQHHFYEFLLKELKINQLIEQSYSQFPEQSERLSEFLIFIVYQLLVEDKFYAPYFLNKGFLHIIQVARKKLNQQEENQEKLQIFLSFICKFIAGIEINQIPENQKAFFIDNLCKTIHYSNQQINIFESLLNLTRMTGETDIYNYRIWSDNKLDTLLPMFILDQIQMTKVISIELTQNLILNQRVFQEFIQSTQKKEVIIHLSEIIKIFMKNKKQYKFTDQDIKFEYVQISWYQ